MKQKASAWRENILSRAEAIELVNALKIRPDVWLSAELRDAVTPALQAA